MSHFHQFMTNDTIYNTKSNPQYHYSGTSVDSKDTLIETSACVSLTDKYNYSNSKRAKSYVFFFIIQDKWSLKRGLFYISVNDE